MNTINLKREITANLDDTIAKVTEALKGEGFGILTRIDFHTKIKEKLGKDILPTVILGACNPQLAYEAFIVNTDVASLLPCNVVVRETQDGRVSVEIAKPSAMMEMIGEKDLQNLSSDADRRLQGILEKL